MDLHYRSEGKGFPLIILHGFLGSLDNWRPVSRRLATFYRVFAVDLRNHGRSPHDDTFNYRVMAKDLADFTALHRIPLAHLLGHSMGGKVAMEFATRHPENVEKLVVVDISPKAYPSAPNAALEAVCALDLAAFKSLAEVDQALAKKIPEDRLRQFLLKNVARDRSMGLKWRINLKAVADNYDGLNREIVASKRFEKPACFIRGGCSSYMEESELEAIRKSFSLGRMVTVPDAGHWVHADAPEDFFRIVLEFLGTHGD